jgi:hypothetical protein
MKTVAIKMMIVSVALGVGLIALAGTAEATHVNAAITVVGEAEVGQPLEVQASLRSAADGSPIAGTAVTFYMGASFGGVDGYVELGQQVTDENGVAALAYEPRLASDHELRAEYLIPGESEPEVITRSISVLDDGTQLHQSTAGVQIPGLNVWLLIALVSTVWAILLSVAVRVIAISNAGSEGSASSKGGALGLR